MQTGGSNSQSARYLQHLAWPAAAKKRESRRTARARAKSGKRVCGEGAWSGGRGFVSDNPRQIKQSHTPRYTVEQCAADCQRFASTAAHFRLALKSKGCHLCVDTSVWRGILRLETFVSRSPFWVPFGHNFAFGGPFWGSFWARGAVLEVLFLSCFGVSGQKVVRI